MGSAGMGGAQSGSPASNGAVLKGGAGGSVQETLSESRFDTNAQAEVLKLR